MMSPPTNKLNKVIESFARAMEKQNVAVTFSVPGHDPVHITEKCQFCDHAFINLPLHLETCNARGDG